MKKHLLPLAAILLLSSCTSVEDFGAYWDKGFVDPALEGTWKKIGLPGEKLTDTPGPDQLLFVKDGRSYAFRAIDPLDKTLPANVAAQIKKDNDTRFALRSLRIGKHRFFLVRGMDGAQDAMIERYEIKGDLLLEYFMDNGAVLDFLEAKHPTAKSIGGRDGADAVVIEVFDDEVFQILSEIADVASYWNLQCQYRKAK